MTPEDKEFSDENRLDTELKALYNAYWQGLQIIKNSEYPELEFEKDVVIWKGMMANRKKIAEKAFALEIAESRLFYLEKGKKL